MPATLHGSCHCENVEVDFHTAVPLDRLLVRACTCGFCSRHGARAVSDPEGHLHVRVRDPARVIRYTFGLRTAEFLVCATCGVYVAAVLTEGDRAWATLNANVLAEQGRLTRPPEPVSYDGETADERRTRRKARWTPATVG